MSTQKKLKTISKPPLKSTSQGSTNNDGAAANNGSSIWGTKPLYLIPIGQASLKQQEIIHSQIRKRGGMVASRPEHAEILIVANDAPNEPIAKILKDGKPRHVVLLSWAQEVIKKNSWVDLSDPKWLRNQQCSTNNTDSTKSESTSSTPPPKIPKLPSTFPLSFRSSAIGLLEFCAKQDVSE